MSGIVERLRNISRGDHERGCQGREYVCSCDYDETSWNTAEEAADEIERLQAALREIRDYVEVMPVMLESAIVSIADAGLRDRAEADRC